jgi:hypothetical protein
MCVLLLIILSAEPNFKSINLLDLKGKWAFGVYISGLALNYYSFLWRPWKTFMIGITGNADYVKGENWTFFYPDPRGGRDHKMKYWSIGVEFYKYFRAHSSVPFFISMSPKVGQKYIEFENEEPLAGKFVLLSISPGIEYFFKFYTVKQMNFRVKANICRFKYSRDEIGKGDDKEEGKQMAGEVYSPMKGPITLWLNFYF